MLSFVVVFLEPTGPLPSFFEKMSAKYSSLNCHRLSIVLSRVVLMKKDASSA